MFKIWGTKKKENEFRKRPLSPAERQNIVSYIGKRAVPPMPSAAQKAFSLSTNPNAEARDFIEIIESDEALSARVVRIANSVFYDRGHKKETIEECVTAIGINELRCLLNATTLSELFPSKHPARDFLWQHDVATALFARQLAQSLAPGKEELAFLAGLMHDIGKLLLIQRAGAEYQKVLDAIRERGVSFVDAEEQEFGFTHTQLGQLIGEQWNFSDELLMAIRYHHHPFLEEELRGGPLSLPMIVKCGDTIAHALAIGHPTSLLSIQRQAEQELDDVWKVTGVQPNDQTGMLQQYRKLFKLEYDLYGG